MCAVHDGRSIASTMGFTALDGSEYDQAKKPVSSSSKVCALTWAPPSIAQARMTPTMARVST